LEAIWCAAEANAPWRAMNSAISVKEVTSTRMDKPAGRPSRRKRAICAGSGRSNGRHSRSGPYIVWRRSIHQPSSIRP